MLSPGKLYEIQETCRAFVEWASSEPSHHGTWHHWTTSSIGNSCSISQWGSLTLDPESSQFKALEWDWQRWCRGNTEAPAVDSYPCPPQRLKIKTLPHSKWWLTVSLNMPLEFSPDLKGRLAQNLDYSLLWWANQGRQWKKSKSSWATSLRSKPQGERLLKK